MFVKKISAQNVFYRRDQNIFSAKQVGGGKEQELDRVYGLAIIWRLSKSFEEGQVFHKERYGKDCSRGDYLFEAAFFLSVAMLVVMAVFVTMFMAAAMAAFMFVVMFMLVIMFVTHNVSS